MKKSFLTIGTGIVLLAGVILYALSHPASAPAPESGIVAGAGASLPPGVYTEHAPYYDIAANYATSTPLAENAGARADAAAVSSMRDFVASTIDRFKTDGNFAHLTPEDVKMRGFDGGRAETLQIVYLMSSSARTVSYIFTVYEDTGGAHGNTFFHTFTFDSSTGAPLALADLFIPGADYLGTLSSLARAKLPAIIGDGADAQMLDNGTAPDAKNFENFFLDNGNLDILFAPYAVAPYAAGPQTLPVPLADLSRILKPEYR